VEKCFSDCKSDINEIMLPFDFYLEEMNILIEFDGEFHTKVVENYGGKKLYDRYQILDEIKNKYSEKKGIPLLRISYTEMDNIDSILNEKIKNNVI
jgi:very-short-patch-repair endonuclease